MLTLYQFPISHFCEKARWALDYKGLPYRRRNLLPGPHVKVVRRIAKRSTVPVLVHDGRAIQNTADIITYLDQLVEERPLTPPDDPAKAEALEWERYCDVEVGVHVRRLCYHTLLDHPSLTIPMLTQDGPWYGPMLIRLVYPKLVRKMRTLMDINDDMRDLIVADASIDDLRVLARSQGMTTLREAGLKLIFDGLTTIDEVVRETVMENLD